MKFKEVKQKDLKVGDIVEWDLNYTEDDGEDHTDCDIYYFKITRFETIQNRKWVWGSVDCDSLEEAQESKDEGDKLELDCEGIIGFHRYVPNSLKELIE